MIAAGADGDVRQGRGVLEHIDVDIAAGADVDAPQFAAVAERAVADGTARVDGDRFQVGAESERMVANVAADGNVERRDLGTAEGVGADAGGIADLHVCQGRVTVKRIIADLDICAVNDHLFDVGPVRIVRRLFVCAARIIPCAGRDGQRAGGVVPCEAVALYERGGRRGGRRRRGGGLCRAHLAGRCGRRGRGYALRGRLIRSNGPAQQARHHRQRQQSGQQFAACLFQHTTSSS